MTINFRGYIFDDAGNAVSGASVKLLDTGTSTQEGSTVTSDSNGLWNFDTVAEADGPFDVEITKGSSVRRIRWDDQIQLKEIDVRNNTGATTPALTAVNFTNNASNQAAVFRSDRGTGNAADGDEVYLSFNLRNDNNEEHEFARLTAEAVDVSNGSEDGQFRFGASVSDGTMTDVFTINSSTGGAATISYEVDSFTIKGGEGEAGVLYLFADQGDDAGDEWKVNVADGGVLTIGNDIASAGSYVTMMTITPHATTASSSVAIAGDATVGDDLSLTSDSSVFNMGAGNDFTITHDGTTGATLAGNPITITSAGAATWSTSAGALTIDAAAAALTLDGHTGVTVQSSNSGDITLDSVADIVLDSAGNDWHFKNAGNAQMLLRIPAVATVAQSSGVTVDTFLCTTYQATKYLILVEDVDNNNFMTCELLVLGDDAGSAAYLTQYAVVYNDATDKDLGVFTATESSDTITLTYTANDTNGTSSTGHKVRAVATRIASH